MTAAPQPKGLPLIGNLRDIDPENTTTSLMRLADAYGPIFRLDLLSGSRLFLGSQDLVNEMCDEKRFVKRPSGALGQVRNGISDGLFTAFPEEENWGIAHRVLMPMFGPLALKTMFDEMHELACQMVSSWARHGPENKINMTDDFTKLTLDSIALCAMDTRFNSFYRHDLHPFVSAMQYFLKESGLRAARPEFVSNYVYRQSTKEYWDSIELMRTVANHVIEERRAHPQDKKDLVNAMLYGHDPKSGKSMPHENIINNMITFLIAGHETTSGLLSFLFTLLLQSPRVMKKAQQEVDEVLGTRKIEFHHLDKLPYISSCIREALRLYPTAPAFQTVPVSNEDKDFPMYIGKDKYEIRKGDSLVAVLPVLHRDPVVYGEDANDFKPERMSDERFAKLPPNSWKPFGNGARACIGRAFALQEAIIAVALLLQNFNFRADDPGYQMQIVQTLTIKPKDSFMYATLREGLDPISLEKRLWRGGETHKVDNKDKKLDAVAEAAIEKKPLTILYGSNTGTCEALAQSLANNAVNHGYQAEVKPMDAGTEKVPKDQPVIIITASYEGEPTDNACHFFQWLQSLKGKELQGVSYAVFGCGHRDWQSTFQHIPKLVDKAFGDHGATAITSRGYADAADNDIFNDFDKWSDEKLWPCLVEDTGKDSKTISHGLDVEFDASPRGMDLRQDVSEAIVKNVESLTAAGEPEKRHIEIQLPSGMTYRAGDYLAILPINQGSKVKSVMSRFGLPWDVKMTIRAGQNTFLPTGRELSVYNLLASYVELGQPATQKNLAVLQHFVPDQTAREDLEKFATAHASSKRVTVLDILEEFPSIELPFGDYLAMLPPMRVRQYSISSSPLHDQTSVTLTYGVLDQEAPITGKRYLGTASNYLSELRKGDRVYVSVRPSHQSFHPPLDVPNVPVLMVCAGSGLAPFRGFVQERAEQMKAGRKLAPALLFVGCRSATKDRLYADLFKEWTDAGAIDVRYAFSKEPDNSNGCKYVQDRLWKDREDAQELWDKGARIFVCGNREVGDAVKEAVIKSYSEKMARKGLKKTAEDAEEWFKGIKNERFASDVFA